MEKKIVGILDGGPVCINDISDMKKKHADDKRTGALREHEFGGHGNVKNKIIFFSKRCRAEVVNPMFRSKCVSKL